MGTNGEDTTAANSVAIGAGALAIIATAILDRLLHHSTTVNIRGESYRPKDRRKAGLIPQPKKREETK
jgi:hypothetical protein